MATKFYPYIVESHYSYTRIFAPETSAQRKAWRVACGLISGEYCVGMDAGIFWYEPRYMVYDRSERSWFAVYSVNGEFHQVELPK